MHDCWVMLLFASIHCRGGGGEGGDSHRQELVWASTWIPFVMVIIIYMNKIVHNAWQLSHAFVSIYSHICTVYGGGVIAGRRGGAIIDRGSCESPHESPFDCIHMNKAWQPSHAFVSIYSHTCTVYRGGGYSRGLMWPPIGVPRLVAYTHEYE